MSDSYLLPAFHFNVGLDVQMGASDASFAEVGGIGSSMTTEDVMEGGENSFAWKLPTVVKHPNLTLKRGVASRTSPLVLWCQSVLETGLGISILTRTLWVSLLNEEGTPARIWSFYNVYPVQWKVDPFNATKNDIAIEQIELAYHGTNRLL